MIENKYSDIRIRKVKILRGDAKESALSIGATDNDLVILRTSEYNPRPTYSAERIVGDPVSYLMRKKE